MFRLENFLLADLGSVCPWNERQSYFQIHVSWLIYIFSEFCFLPLCSLSSSHFLSMNVSHAARSQLAPSVFCPENSLARCLYSESYVPYCQLCRRQYGLLFYYCLAGIASNGSLLPSLQLVTNGDSHISTLLLIQSQRHHFQAFVLSHFTFRCH